MDNEEIELEDYLEQNAELFAKEFDQLQHLSDEELKLHDPIWGLVAKVGVKAIPSAISLLSRRRRSKK